MSESPVTEITPETPCDRCGHPRSDHGEASPDYPSVCTHRLPDEADGYYGVCSCLAFLLDLCDLCEGDGEVLAGAGLNDTGRPRIVPCPACNGGPTP